MKNIFLSVVVVATLVAAGVGGTFAGFVDTELVEKNLYQAGIMDLLVDGSNDPITLISIQWGQPCKSYDFDIEVEYWGESTHNGDFYLHFKDVNSTEDGAKEGLVWDGTDYVVGTPVGAGVATSEPELGAEEGAFFIGDLWIVPDPLLEPGLMGVDYASGVADHLSIGVRYFDPDGNGILDNPDLGIHGGNDNGVLDPFEKDLPGWVSVVPPGLGKLVDWDCIKTYVGKLQPQVPTWILFTVHLQQIQDPLYPRDYDLDGDIDDDDLQKSYWPTNALQGDISTWTMMFELIADP